MLDLERNNEILQKIAAKLRLLRRKAGLLQKTVSAETGLNMGHLEGARKNVTCLPGLFLKSPFAAWRSGLAVTAVPVGAGSRK